MEESQDSLLHQSVIYREIPHIGHSISIDPWPMMDSRVSFDCLTYSFKTG